MSLDDASVAVALSKVARIRLSEMVDPNYVVIAKVAKKYLPPKAK